MSTVWEKLRGRVKATVDEAGLELEKQRKIYALRKEIGQHEATIREIEAELKRLEQQRSDQFQKAGEIAYSLQKDGKLGELWEDVAKMLETVPDLEAKMEEEEGAVAAVRQEIDKFREQIEGVREEYGEKKATVRETVAEEARAEAPEESAKEQAAGKKTKTKAKQ
jgi:chromosome segregation ATPase